MTRPGDMKAYNFAAKDKNYCLKCWAEFTTLTERERKNLQERALFIKESKRNGLIT